MKSIDRKPADQNTAQAIKRLQQQIGDLRNEIDSLSKTAITTEEDNILELEPNTFNGNDSPPNSLNSQIYVKQSDGELYYSNSRNVETRLNVDNTTALNAKQDALTFGIADTNTVKINSASVADDEYARFTASGLESRSNAEVLSDIGAVPLAGGTMTGHLNISNADINFSQASLMVNGSGNVDKIYGDGSDIVIAKDDDDVILIKDTETRFEHPVKIKEQASANADSTARGQIWVKNDTPNNLYFTNDAGNDVQITNGASLASAGGGTDTWVFQAGARWATRYDRWWFPNASYGFNYFIWTGTLNSSSLPSQYYDNWNPNIVVPKNLTLKSYKARGSFNSTQTYQLALLTGTPTYGTIGNTNLTQIGSTQSINANANYQQELGESGLNVSLSAGDILVPALRRTTTNNSTYYYFYMNFELIGEYT